MEATVGFEPTNRDFADLRLRPLGYVATMSHKFYHLKPNFSTLFVLSIQKMNKKTTSELRFKPC